MKTLLLIMSLLLVIISCNQKEKDKEKEAKEFKKWEVYHKMKNDSLEQILTNIRFTGEMSALKIKQGWRGEKLETWRKNFLDSINKETNKIFIESRKNRDAIYKMEEEK